MRCQTKDWRCFRCGRRFVHARFLARHLIDIHNEGVTA